MNLYWVIFYLIMLLISTSLILIGFLFLWKALSIFSKMYGFLFHFHTMKREKVKNFYFNFLASGEFFWYSFSLCFSSSDILWYLCLPYFLFSFFFLQISFCIYPLLALLIFLYHFHNSFLLYLVAHLCFFWIISFFIRVALIGIAFTHFLHIIKKLSNTFFVDKIRIVHYANCIIFAHISKVNSVSTSFNINNSNIIKNSFLH